jgi:opacity protein-like surface antigen
MKMTKQVLMAGVLALATGVALQAAEPEGWKVEVTPYAWLAGLEGDVTVKGHKAEFDKSFSDMLDYVEMAGSLLTVVQYDRYLVWGQVDYFSLSTDALDIDDQPDHGKLDTTMVISEVAAGYQVDGWMEGQTFDLLLGARLLHMENELKIDGVGKASKEQDIWNPIVVVRPSIPLFPSKIEGLRFNPTLAVGGGGGNTKLTYELAPQVEYAFNDNVALRFGYRRIGYQFNGSGDNELNFDMAGLMVGLGVMF